MHASRSDGDSRKDSYKDDDARATLAGTKRTTNAKAVKDVCFGWECTIAWREEGPKPSHVEELMGAYHCSTSVERVRTRVKHM